ncbi:MAG: TetR/AcrR family transcriptional regulator [Propionibacteriaceae bacterium]
MTESDDLALPHAVALSWGSAAQPNRGPRRELSIERIVEAAIEMADAEGLAAVSMSRLATSLGFTTMSLYRYVTRKDDLLLLMQDAALDVPIPPESAESDWRAELREWVTLTLDIFRAHPWFSDIPISGVPITPNNLRLVDWGLRCLRDTGMPGQAKMAVILLGTGYARTYAMLERDLRQAADTGSTTGAISGTRYSAALQELVTEQSYPYLRPVLMSGAYTDDVEQDTDLFDDFAFGLERILDGIEHFLQSSAGRSEPELLASVALDPAVVDRREFYAKDEKVRAAAAARRELEGKLREALNREREAIRKARERAEKVKEKQLQAERRAAAKS